MNRLECFSMRSDEVLLVVTKLIEFFAPFTYSHLSRCCVCVSGRTNQDKFQCLEPTATFTAPDIEIYPDPRGICVCFE